MTSILASLSTILNVASDATGSDNGILLPSEVPSPSEWTSDVAPTLFTIAIVVAAVILLVVLSIQIVKRWRKYKMGIAANEPAVKLPVCPACRKPTNEDFESLPRIAVPRRVVSFGAYTIILPDIPSDQKLKVCETCREVALTLIHVERAKFVEQEAKDERSKLEKLADFQRTLPDKVRELRFPTTTPNSGS